MNIKVERLYRLDTDTELKAFADISIDDSIVIKALRIVQGKDGLFVGMPKELGKDGRWYDRVAVLKEEIKNAITDIVLSTYNKE